MIPANAAQQAIRLVEQLEAANRRVEAADDTPLAQLVTASAIMLKPNTQGLMGADLTAVMNAEYVPNAQQIEADSRIESIEHETLSQHDVLMDSLVDDMSQAVGQHLTFAKNTVRPMIQTFVEESSAALSGFPDISTYSVNIHRVDMPAVAQLPAIENEIKKFKDTTYLPVNSAVSLSPMSGVEAAALMNTGAETVDQAIAAWVQEKGETFFETVYIVFFAATAKGVSLTPEQMVMSKVDGMEAMTAAFLMGRHLLDNVPEGAPYTLVDYRMAVGTIVEQCGQRLCKAYEDREAYIKNEILILTYTKDDVWVCAPVYDKWLQDGGNQAVLFGNMLLDRPNTSIPAIAVDQEQALKAWERYNLFLNTTAANRRFDAAKETLKFTTRKLVADNLAAIFGEVVADEQLTLETTQVKETLDRATAYIDFLDMDQIKDLWNVGTEVVAGTLFSYSSACVILRGIEHAVKNNPEIDANEAALLSTIEYVTNWVVDQIELRDL